jgi:hypothetical protein
MVRLGGGFVPLSELNILEAFNVHYREIVEVIGVEATIKLHGAFNGRRILCVKHLYDIEYIVKLAVERKDNKYIERLVGETGYSYDWIKSRCRNYNKMLQTQD